MGHSSSRGLRVGIAAVVFFCLVGVVFCSYFLVMGQLLVSRPLGVMSPDASKEGGVWCEKVGVNSSSDVCGIIVRVFRSTGIYLAVHGETLFFHGDKSRQAEFGCVIRGFWFYCT